VKAWIRLPSGQWRRIALLEADPNGPDAGTYSERLDTLPAVDGSYLVCVDAVRRAGTIRYVPTHPFQVDPQMTTPVNLSIPAFRLRKLLSFVASSSGRFDKTPLYGWNPIPPAVPLDQADRVRAWMEFRDQQ
jgi:hypothetical protein